MGKNRDKLFVDIAKRISEESTCARVQVGAVVVRDRRIVSTGYNGVPARMKHCQDWMADQARRYKCDTQEAFFEKVGEVEYKRIHAEYSKFEIHAEQNAINFAARAGISVEDATLYTVWSPCLSCANSIIASGISRVVYVKLYDRENTIAHLKSQGVEVFQYRE